MAKFKPMTRLDLFRVTGNGPAPWEMSKPGSNAKAYYAEIVPRDELIAALNDCAARLRNYADNGGGGLGDLIDNLENVPDFATDEEQEADDYQSFDPEGSLNDLAIDLHAYSRIEYEIGAREREEWKATRKAERARAKLTLVA